MATVCAAARVPDESEAKELEEAGKKKQENDQAKFNAPDENELSQKEPGSKAEFELDSIAVVVGDGKLNTTRGPPSEK